MLRRRERGSIACEIYARLALRRDVLRWALLRLRYSRVLQLALYSIVCSPRFEYSEGGGGGLLPTA